MNKLEKVSIWLITILIVIVFSVVLFSFGGKEKQNHYFTDDPKSWMVENSENGVDVNIFKATEGKSIFEVNQQDYEIDGDFLSLFSRGFYKGRQFSRMYIDPVFFNDSLDLSEEEKQKVYKDYVKMEIGPNLDPNDGIIEGFVMLRLEELESGIYIFVDEDWRKQLEFTNILWGGNFKDLSSLHVIGFDFRDSIDGVYINKISGDLEWFLNVPVKGGLVVGEININIINDIVNQEQNNNTFMFVR